MTIPSDKPSPERFAALERAIRRLVWWNRVWMTILVLAALWTAGKRAILHAVDLRNQLYASLRNGALRVSIDGDRPYVVTELCASTSAGTVVADLSPPLVLPADDSGGPILDTASLRRMKWHTWAGRQKVPPPDIHTIRLMYYQPSVIWPQESASQ